MTQLLRTTAADIGLGLCSIGYVDVEALRVALGVDGGVELLHSLIGGTPAVTQTRAVQASDIEARASRALERVRQLTDAQIQALLRASREPKS